ncbi:MAG: YqjK family protein [Sulfuritalea sp.]|nr:YqjK family protein [Sulfuritalea sp.]MDP1981808.1 YqjK family protein [Sulfuritalea sp.]
MNPAALELALRKQRLQIAGDSLRKDFGRFASGLTPVFGAADYAVEGARWLKRNPELMVAAGVALVVVRPGRAWRWGRRAFLGWQAWRKLRELLDRRQPA